MSGDCKQQSSFVIWKILNIFLFKMYLEVMDVMEWFMISLETDMNLNYM